MIRRLAASALCLVAGVMPYVLWRHDAIFLSPLHTYLPHPATRPPTWILDHLSDAAWYMALILAASAIARDTAAEKAAFGLTLALPFVSETLQIADNFPGTFDTYDILTYLIILTIYLIIHKIRCKKSKFPKPSCSRQQ